MAEICVQLLKLHKQPVRGSAMGRRLWVTFLPMILSLFITTSHSCLRDINLEIRQSPKYVLAHPGESVNITCSVETKTKVIGIHLIKSHQMTFSQKVFYIYKDGYVTPEQEYENHVIVNGHVNNFTVTLKDLKESNTDLYLCQGIKDGDLDIYGTGTLVVVTASNTGIKGGNLDKYGTGSSVAVTASNTEISCVEKTSWLPLHMLSIIMVSVFVLVVSNMIYFLWRLLKWRQSHSELSRPINIVYEDMTQTLRRNTMGNTNCYRNT